MPLVFYSQGVETHKHLYQCSAQNQFWPAHLLGHIYCTSGLKMVLQIVISGSVTRVALTRKSSSCGHRMLALHYHGYPQNYFVDYVHHLLTAEFP